MKSAFEDKPKKVESSVEEGNVLDLIYEKLDFDRLRAELESVFGRIREEDAETLRKEIANQYSGEGDEKYLEEIVESMARNNKMQNAERLRAIDEAMEGFGKIVLELKEKIGDYDAILSDDASGRLISLILREVFKNEKGEGLPTNFVLAGRYLEYPRRIEKMKEYLEDRLEGVEKILIVTEYIETGRGLSKLLNVLREMGIDFDIAALSTSRALPQVSYLESFDDLIVGKKDSNIGVNLFYKRPEYSGVDKQRQGAYPRDEMPDISELPAHPAKARKFNAETVNEARHDVKIIAEELSKLLEK
ncbi:MAG: hypothetical protein R3346_03155 [Candidatus Spechtbacterales bacterium]|nr:hypothetical protein [Candidatus Spechtbacterales bacterium]